MAFCFFILLLNSCSTQQKQQDTTSPPPITSEKPLQNERILKGHYIFGAEVNTFKPCHLSKTYWVDGESDTLALLQKKYLKLKVTPYDKVYLEIEGDLKEKVDESDGFENNYDGIVLISSIKNIRAKSQEDCLRTN